MRRGRLRRGDIWSVDLAPTRGHEQAEKRPCLILSVDKYNHGPAGLVIVIPLTTTGRGLAMDVRIDPPEGGLKATSFARCDMIRSVSSERVSARWGQVRQETLWAVEDRLKALLGFSLD